MIPIEKGIPAPAMTSGRPPKYPFGGMEVGDSFALPVDDTTYRRLRAAADSYGRIHGRRFTVRKLELEGVLRCWRVG